MSSFIVRNEDGALGRVIFSFRLPSPFPGKYAVRFKRFTRGKKGQECEPSWRIVISSEAEKSSLQTAQRCVLENGKTLHQGIVSVKRHVGCIPLCKKDPSTALGMTIRGMRYSLSFQRKEGVSTRAPSLGRGCRAQRGGVGFLFCSGAASSSPSPSGKGDRVSGG